MNKDIGFANFSLFLRGFAIEPVFESAVVASKHVAGTRLSEPLMKPSLPMFASISMLICGGSVALLSQRTFGTTQEASKDELSDGRIFVETIVESGSVRGVHDMGIKSPFSRTMTVAECVDDMSEVKQGDVILKFDDSKEREAVSAARAKVSEARASIAVARARAESLEQQRESSNRLMQLQEQLGKARSEAAKAQSKAESGRKTLLEAAIKRYENLCSLYKAAATAPDFSQLSALEKIQLETGAVASETKLAELRNDIAADSAGLTEIPVLEAAAEVEQRRFEGQQQLNLIQEARLQTLHEIEKLEQDQTDSNGVLDRAEKELADCTIVAPRDGIVVYDSSIATRRAEPVVLEAGGTVPSRSSLVRILDRSQFQVEGRLNSAKVSRVRVGQPVIIEIDGFVNSPLKGKIKSIDQLPLPGAWPNSDLVEFPFVVEFDGGAEGDSSKALRHGLVCVIRIDVR